MRKLFAAGAVVLIVAALYTFYPRTYTHTPARTYDVRILRDTWGVPHVFGKTDVDAAYGLAYAHAEDDFATILDALLAARGTLASLKGREQAPIDYIAHLMRVWDFVNAKYETDLSPDVRAVCEAYADGLMCYAAHHPKSVPRGLLPFTGKDVVAGFVFKAPFFFGAEKAVRELFEPERKRPVSTKNPAVAYADFLAEGLPIGSNGFAVAPSRSADGATRLNINAHQPWEGPVAWYEAHVHSEEGWDIVGGTFPGVPLILVGHNRNLGWAHTVNEPDLVDVYVLDINPDNPNQYKFDGQWRDFEVRMVPITVKLWGPFSWTVKREALWCVYGPAVRQPHGVYALRVAGTGDIRQVEQWFRMNKARDFSEWQNAMRMQAIASFNCVYADREGNIYYLYNALLPLRADGYDWGQYVPGNTSETLWTEYLPFEKLPQVNNPASGFILNSNSSPFQATVGPENPREDEYSPAFGIETRMTNRALRAMELLSADDSITEEEFFTYKYDMAYSKNSEVAKTVQQLCSAPPPEDPLAREALEVLKTWDLRVNPENTAAAIGILTIGPHAEGGIRGGSVSDMMERLAGNARALKEAHGRIDVPWGEVNRLYRGSANLPIGGGPDVLHAVYGSRIAQGKLEGLEHGQLHGRAGDCYVLIVAWDKDGTVCSRSIHQYGSATLDVSSPHYADQAHLFVRREMKPVWMDEQEIRANLEREYRPGATP